MRKIFAFVLAMVMIAGATACRKNASAQVPATPQTPAETYDRSVLGATTAVEAISEALVGVDKARKDLQTTGQIDATVSAAILVKLQQIAAKNETARVTCKLAADSGDTTIQWQARLLDVIAEAKVLDAKMFGIKNPQSQQAFAAAVSVFQLTIATVEASYAVKNQLQATPTPTPVPAATPAH